MRAGDLPFISDVRAPWEQWRTAMYNDNAILTTKDFTILEAMRENRLGSTDPLLAILKRKLASAIVVFGDDLPETVASLNSRVTFTVNGGKPETRTLVLDGVAATVGVGMPLSTFRGLALMGLAVGQEFLFTSRDGVEERILLEKVNYQPQSSRRQTKAASAANGGRKPLLTVVRGGKEAVPRPMQV